jgi:2-polyprenyl-3-methyl-5-hydroxy-6-metoxy-1,4-benzoquinol methylase
MVHHNNCPLCNSPENGLLLTCADHLVSREKFPLYSCRSCRFVFTNDYPDENNSGKYYESDEYISHTDTEKTLFEKVYRLVRKIMLRRKSKLVSLTTHLSQGSILDIGCGTGHFLNEMKLAGWHTAGIEISPGARNYASSRFALNVVPPEGAPSLADKSFNCITLWHVLEHLHNPGKWFEEIRRLLADDGKVFVALPNCSSFDAAYYRENWAAWDVPRHLWHFNPDTFLMQAKRGGFKVTGIRTLPFDVFYISILSEKQQGSSASFIKGIAKAMIFSLRTLFNRNRASSVVYILQAGGD